MTNDLCRRTVRHLDAFLDGTLPEAVRRALEDHAASCPACRRLLAVAQESAAALRPTAPPPRANRGSAPDLVAGVLARTSGSACPRAESCLPERADGSLAATDRELVDAHLEHCPRCRSLAAALDWILPLLPELAELEPDPRTAAALLQRTRPLLRRRAFRRRVAGLGVATRAGWTRWWQRWWQRPRFALEAAYAATLLVVALMGTPISPLREVPGQALSIVRAGPFGGNFATEFAASPPGRAYHWGTSIARQIATGVSGATDAVVATFESRNRAARPAWRRAVDHAGTALTRGRTGRWPEALREIAGAGTALEEAWHRWWRPAPRAHDDRNGADNEGGGELGSSDPFAGPPS